MLDEDHYERISRRTVLLRGAAALSAGCIFHEVLAEGGESKPQSEATEKQIHDYLRPLLLAREDVDRWLKQQAFPFCKYDAELGYLHIDRDFPEGLDGAVCQYRYDKQGARRMFAHAGEPCRINSYGDSYTSCEQVSDGETWQESLAAHLGEPVRNYGIGAYSVYQEYLRMLREEKHAPARYIIFNIFHDDHVRNLHGWQRFKFGVNRKSPSPTVPHLVVDLDKGTITQRPNPCPTAQSVFELCDLDRVYSMFREDFYLHNRLMRAARKANGEPVPDTDYDDEPLLKHGILGSTWILDRIDEFAKTNGKLMLYVLSYSARAIAQFIKTQRRLDQALVDYLNEARLPYVDLLEAHAADVARFKGTPEEALSRYFVGASGHYNPLGNHFCAFTIKDALVRLLDPKPPAYAR
ncbi:MAG: hypothetical protein L0211_25580 [Planctomycetaceae bacterium]|nr:hypothetical protein [Planctomycetaceae bacterium]